MPPLLDDNDNSGSFIRKKFLLANTVRFLSGVALYVLL